MAIEDQVADRLMQASTQAGISSVRLSIQVSKQLARLLSREGGWILSTATGKMTGLMQEGQISESRLQRISDGDIHEIKLDPQSIRAVSKSLRQAGITYAVEERDERCYLHFRGRDMDHVQHSVERAFEALGLEFDAQDLTPRKVTIDNGLAPDAYATQNARDLIPETVSDDAPPFTMIFNTVKWDPKADIISENLTQMGIPFEQTAGPGISQQSFRFATPYTPAVQRFIDIYSEKVTAFSTKRVENYATLAATARGDISEQQTIPITQQQSPLARDQNLKDGMTAKPPIDREKTPEETQTLNQPPQKTSHTPTKNHHPTSSKRGRTEFLALLNKKAEEKLIQSHQAPTKSLTHKPTR